MNVIIVLSLFLGLWALSGMLVLVRFSRAWYTTVLALLVALLASERFFALLSHPDMEALTLEATSGDWVGLASVSVALVMVLVLYQRHPWLGKIERSLQESEERFNEVLAMASHGLGLVSDGRWLRINAAGAQMLGGEASGEFVGRSVYDFIHPNHRASVARSLKQVTEDREGTAWFEEKLLSIDGDVIDVELRAVPIQYEDQGVALVSFRDLSDLRWMERRLWMLEAAIRQVNEAILLLEPQSSDDDGRRILYANDAFHRMTGRSIEDTIGHPIHEMADSDINDAALHAVRQAFAQEEAAEVDLLLKHDDETAYWARCSVTPIFDADERLVFWVWLQRDITAEKQRHAEGQAKAALLEEAQDAIYVQSLEGYLLYWNRGAERLYGWSDEQLAGRKIDEVLFREDDSLPARAFQRTMRQGRWNGELRPLDCNGEEIVVESRWTLVHGNDGTPNAVLVVNTDVTEKKKLEKQLLRSQRLESIGTLASGIAHDLNNVLNPISMASGLLKQEHTDEASQDLLDTITQSAQRGADIIRQVLTFARGAEGERKVIQPKYVIKDVERLIRETFPRTIRIRTSIAQDLNPIEADVTQLEQVLMNLSVNARDAMTDGGFLSISAENVELTKDEARVRLGAEPGPYVAITISDTGRGIPANVQDNIFEPFFTTKQPTKGTGLGLSTVHSIVTSHEGYIDVESEEGNGATFTVLFPQAEVEEDVVEDPGDQPLPEGRGELILLIDDEKDILVVTRAMLVKHGYEVVTARSGEEALQLVRMHGQDVRAIITDMVMPKMGGLQLIREVRRIDHTLPILASSGNMSHEVLRDLVKAGVRTFLPKPYTTRRLLMALERLLDGSTNGLPEDASDASPPRPIVTESPSTS
ncbi:MAG: PAS domain S-box protein [Bacteroidetes bacterium]|jgi:PAS domain S-box-containing protein|nr:PAS domain S-box protein [Bacteroidota bacterium]